MDPILYSHNYKLLTKHNRTPNDQRSDAHNPTSSEYKANMDNHSNQFNPSSPANKSARNNRANQMNPNSTLDGF
jgi:hypothetical protein